jgi:hypothetical protein
MAAGQQRLLKRAGWLLAALGLLALAGFLMLQPGERRRRREALEFPRYQRPVEMERQRQRSTLLARPPNPSSSAQPEPPDADPELRLDPVHVALAGQGIGVVLEASAIKDSPLGRMLLACLSPRDGLGLDELEQKVGIRPLEQVDRVAISSNGVDEPVLIVSGDVAGFNPAGLGDGVAFEPLGAQGRYAEQHGQAVALWGGQLLLLGKPDGVRATLERLEAGAAPEAQSLSAEAYGEMYGTLSGSAASVLLPNEMRERFRDAAERVNVHVDARDDLLLVAEVYGSKQDALEDLGRVIGAAFALGRLQAAREKEPMLADLLDESRVIPGAGSFQIEMALPLATIQEQLGECAKGGSALEPRAP